MIDHLTKTDKTHGKCSILMICYVKLMDKTWFLRNYTESLKTGGHKIYCISIGLNISLYRTEICLSIFSSSVEYISWSTTLIR